MTQRYKIILKYLHEGLNLVSKKPFGMIKLPDTFKNYSVSHGTLIDTDIIAACLEVLHQFYNQWNVTIREKIDNIDYDFLQIDPDEITESDSLLLWDVCELMDEVAPTGTSFGAHIGDGSDMGFWEYDDDEYGDDEYGDDEYSNDDLEENTYNIINEGLNLPKKKYVIKWFDYPTNSGNSGGWSKYAKHRPKPVLRTIISSSVIFNGKSVYVDGIRKLKLNIYDLDGTPIREDYSDIKFG